MAVNRYADNFSEAYWKKIGENKMPDQVEMNRVPGYQQALHDKGVLSSLVKMANGDSIGLFINLPDSTVQLMVKGVGVRNIRIEDIQISSFFKKADQEAVYDLLSEPLNIVDSKSTIDKEPLNVLQAPKDSQAADSIPMLKPDTTHSEPVFFILNTDKNVRLYFHQADNDNGKDSRAGWNFEMADRWNEVKRNLKAMSAFSVPEYIPTISIGVNKVDAKVIYRAIPPHGQIVLTK